MIVVAVLDPGVEDDALPDLEAVHALAERFDDTRAVRAEDPRLRHRREAPPHPDVEVVERCGMDPDEHLAGGRDGIRHLLDAQHLGAAVLVDARREHGTILS